MALLVGIVSRAGLIMIGREMGHDQVLFSCLGSNQFKREWRLPIIVS